MDGQRRIVPGKLLCQIAVWSLVLYLLVFHSFLVECIGYRIHSSSIKVMSWLVFKCVVNIVHIRTSSRPKWHNFFQVLLLISNLCLQEKPTKKSAPFKLEIPREQTKQDTEHYHFEIVFINFVFPFALFSLIIGKATKY